jgi:phosphate:Na+ symporter
VDLVGVLVEMSMGVNPVGLDYDAFPNKGQYAAVVTVAIATTHTVFNVTNTVLFLPFVRSYAALLERMVPDRGERGGRSSGLDLRLVDTPVLAIEKSRGEVLRMSSQVREMMDGCEVVIRDPERADGASEAVLRVEREMDEVQREVMAFLTRLLGAELPRDMTVEGRQQLRIADEYESVSDYASGVVKALLRIRDAGAALSDDERGGLEELHASTVEFMEFVGQALERDILPRGGAPSRERLQRAIHRDEAMEHAERITNRAKELRAAYTERLSAETNNPEKTIGYLATLNGYRKIGDHLLNVAEAMAEG